jgi:beta-phosphoglucomutase
MNIKAVVFDMDGVLIDAREWHYLALNQALAPFNLEISESEHEKRFNGLSTAQKLRILSEETGLPKEMHPIISEVKQDRTLRLAATFCYPNVQHQILLSRLKVIGLKLGLYTNSIRQTTEYMLRHAQIDKYLDSIVTNQDVMNPKPAPDGYLLSAKNLGLLPSEILVIEDGEYGIQAARDAGCHILEVNGPDDVSIELLMQYIPEINGEK